jgi:DNA-binding transcriptional LysR family regulator
MARTDLNDIAAFLTVAREGSFTKAAAKLSATLVRPLPRAFLPFGQSSLSAHLRRCT